jgi:hypothetical protein
MRESEYKNLIENLQPRIDSLVDQDKYIEAFFFLSNILENLMSDLIELQEEYYIRIAKNKHKKIDLPSFRKQKYSYGMTLGAKEDYLSIFQDTKLLDEKFKLKYFIKLRNKCAHNLIKEDINKINLDIKKDINNFYKLLHHLSIFKVSLLKSDNLSKNRKIMKLKKEVSKNKK